MRTGFDYRHPDIFMVLTDAQRKKLADICADIGQVALASIALPFLLEDFRPELVILGLANAIAFWYASLVLLK